MDASAELVRMEAARVALLAVRAMPKGAGLVPCTCELPPSPWPSMWPPGMRCARHRRLVKAWETGKWEGVTFTRF
jgi:hypothetical protein